MSMVTISKKKNRVYPRKFDHEEAIELHARGYSVNTLAAHFNVTPTAILRVVNPQARARIDGNAARHQKSAVCPDCGGPMMRSSPSRPTYEACRSCKDRRRSERTLLARLDADGNILCRRCGNHHPPDRMRWTTTRGGFAIPTKCLDCEAEVRRAYRKSHAEREREYDREYKLRRRTAMTPAEREHELAVKAASNRRQRARKKAAMS